MAHAMDSQDVASRVYASLQSEELGLRLALADPSAVEDVLARALTESDPANQLVGYGEQARGPHREVILAWSDRAGGRHHEVIVLDAN